MSITPTICRSAAVAARFLCTGIFFLHCHCVWWSALCQAQEDKTAHTPSCLIARSCPSLLQQDAAGTTSTDGGESISIAAPPSASRSSCEIRKNLLEPPLLGTAKSNAVEITTGSIFDCVAGEGRHAADLVKTVLRAYQDLSWWTGFVDFGEKVRGTSDAQGTESYVTVAHARDMLRDLGKFDAYQTLRKLAAEIFDFDRRGSPSRGNYMGSAPSTGTPVRPYDGSAYDGHVHAAADLVQRNEDRDVQKSESVSVLEDEADLPREGVELLELAQAQEEEETGSVHPGTLFLANANFYF